MKSIIKTFVFGMFLFVAVGVKAQTVSYDFETIRYVPMDKKLYISRSNNEYESIPVEKTKGFGDISFLLSYVKEQTEQGWRVINVIDAGYVVFYLERKKKEQ